MERPVHLIVLVGIPGSGKTTYARRLLARCPMMKSVSPDSIRDKIYPGYEQGLVEHAVINQQLIFGIAYRELGKALAAGHDVIFDATNLTRAARKPLVRLAQRHGAVPIAHYFPIHLYQALPRNRRRQRQVDPEKMAQMSGMLQPPTRKEGFARVVVHEQN